MTTWDTVSHCQKKISPVSLNTFSLPRNRSWVKGLSLVDENRQNEVPLTFTTSSPSTIFNFSKFSWSSCGFIRHLSRPSKPTKIESRQAELLFTGLNCPYQDLPGPAYTYTYTHVRAQSSQWFHTILGELCGAHERRDAEDIPGADRQPPNAAGASTQGGPLVLHVVSVRRKSQVRAGILHFLAVSLETTP